MKIRSAEKRDFDTIKVLVKAHAEFEKASALNDENLNQLESHIFNTETIKCLVVEIDTKIVGYATFLKQFSTWDANYYVYLDCLYLNEKTRGKGVGTSIMEAIKTYAKSENCAIIQWQTPDFNEKAIQFYNKLGASSKSKERFTWSV